MSEETFKKYICLSYPTWKHVEIGCTYEGKYASIKKNILCIYPLGRENNWGFCEDKHFILDPEENSL